MCADGAEAGDDGRQRPVHVDDVVAARANQADQAVGGSRSDQVGSIEPVDGDAGIDERRNHPITPRVDQRDLDGDAPSRETQREVDDDPLDSTEIEALGDQQDAAAAAGSAGGTAILHLRDERTEFAFEAHPTVRLGDEELVAVAALDRRAPESVEVGLAGFVHPAAGERRGRESATHLGFRSVRPRERLGVGEVSRRRSDVFADQFDRPVEFVGDHARVGTVEQGVGVGVRADGDEPGTDRVTQPGPRRRRSAPRERFTGVDELRRHVQGGRKIELDEGGHHVRRRSRRCRRRR